MASRCICQQRLLSSTSKLLHSRSSIPIPPSLLQVSARSFNNTAPIVEGDPAADTLLRSSPPQTKSTRRHGSPNLLSNNSSASISATKVAYSPRYTPERAPQAPQESTQSDRRPLVITPTLREYLPYLTSQPPFYIVIHLHGKPYLVTAGDTVRLPFLMHGVIPGDVLRLDRATILGSRDFTLRAGQPLVDSLEAVEDTVAEPIVGKLDGLEQMGINVGESASRKGVEGQARTPRTYLDDRLFLCRATVMGTESEPMRFKEKTKPRQRRVKTVKSKHRYTILKISEITVKPMRELEELTGDAQPAEA